MSSSRGMTVPAPARGAFAAIQALSPALAARVAERWFFTPPRRPLPGDAEALLQSGRRFSLRVENRPVVGWEWGAGPVIYLVHGWGSRAARLGAFVQPLVGSGYRVVTFDAPGHGASGRGLSSMPEFARALSAVAHRHGPAHAVVAHSLGGSATALAVGWGFAADRFALIAPAADPGAYAYAFAALLGARPEVMDRARANSERRLRFSWTDLDVCRLAAQMTRPAVVIHDRQDDVVPFAEGAAIARSWPHAELVATEGLGHRGVLRDPGVVARVVRFVAGDEKAGVRLEERAKVPQLRGSG